MAETIQVRYLPVSTGMEPVIGKVYHKYLLYTDRNGRQFGLRAGPSPWTGAGATDFLSPPDDSNEETPFGRVQFQDGPFDESFADYPATYNDPSEVLAEGADLSDTWHRLQTTFHDIESLGYNYSPRGVNSNTIIDETLSLGGMRPTRRDGSAGNDNWENERGRLLDIVNTPGLQQLPTTPRQRPSSSNPGLRGNPGRSRQGNMHAGAEGIIQHLANMDDSEFAGATQGNRWRQIWTR